MGRPCLIPGFSAMSEAGASLLNDRLDLDMVPETQLVSLSSPSFHYAYNDRRAYEDDGRLLPNKIGSFQSFLHEYVMVSTFLRRNPLPSRPRSVLERDLEEEQRAHRKSRKQNKARLRKCGVRIKYFLLCRHDFEGGRGEDEATSSNEQRDQEEILNEEDDIGFLWTPDLVSSFRLELEKLIVFDYLCRNTDRGLDNFMVRHIRGQSGEKDTMKLGAIDNSLAWPIKHPDGIRDYPFGWLFLPADLIGGAFSQQTRDHFLPLLSDPKWWHGTERALEKLFRQEEQFNEKLFQSQMAVFKGQGWNVLQSLNSADEGEFSKEDKLDCSNDDPRSHVLNLYACSGPLELCARQRKIVHKDSMIVAQREVWDFQGGKVPLGETAQRVTAGFATAISTSSSSSSPPPTSTSRPIAVKAAGSRAVPSSVKPREATDAADLNDSHPRSLPETSGVLGRQTSADGPSTSSRVPVPATAAAAVDPKPPYGSSLGIEVLETLDRAARQARRPTFSKAISGFDIARGSNEGASRSGWRSNRVNGRAPRSSRPRGHGRSSSEAAFSETSLESDLLSETDEEEEQGGNETISSDRMSSSDYFAYGASGGRRRALPSIQGTLEEGEDAVHKGTAASQALQQAAAVGTSGPPDPRPTRRRMRSVGQWSIGSIGSWGSLNGTTPAGGSTPPAAAAGGAAVNGIEDADRPIKVIVERLVDDRSLPWQAWLRA